MLEMVEDAHEQDDIEVAHGARAYVINVQLPVLHARAEQAADFVKARILKPVDGQNLGAAPLHLEAEPSIPRTDVEHPLAGQVLRDRKLRDAHLLGGQLRDAPNQGAVRQFEGVPPPAPKELAAPLPHVLQWIYFARCHEPGAVFTQQRSTSATLHAWAMHPRGIYGASASKISPIVPIHASSRCGRKPCKSFRPSACRPGCTFNHASIYGPINHAQTVP